MPLNISAKFRVVSSGRGTRAGSPPAKKLEEVYLANFGFMFKPLSKALFFIFVGFLQFGLDGTGGRAEVSPVGPDFAISFKRTTRAVQSSNGGRTAELGRAQGRRRSTCRAARSRRRRVWGSRRSSARTRRSSRSPRGTRTSRRPCRTRTRWEIDFNALFFFNRPGLLSRHAG